MRQITRGVIQGALSRLALCALPICLSIGAGQGSSFPSEVGIPNTKRLEFTSKVNGHRYVLSIALPFEPAPKKGYGVLYVLDGYVYFASAAEAVRGPDKAPGVVVVGIGYPDDPSYVQRVMRQRGTVTGVLEGEPASRVAPFLERFYDLTPPTSDEMLKEMGLDHYKSQNVGGLDDFLKTIETEVKPRVAAIAPIDPGNQAIFGHSLGGSTVLHALFVEPNAFRTYIIASPATFWGRKAVLADEDKFAAAVTAGQAHPHVLVTMGSEESTPPELPASWAMVENARDLVASLKSLHGSEDYIVEDYAVFPKTNHHFSPWPALTRGISFAFPGVHAMLKEDHSTAPGPSSETPPASMDEFRISSHGARLNGLVYLPPGRGPHPPVIFLHGYPGNERNLDLAQAVRRAGFAALYFDYRGDFGSGGTFSFAHSLEDTAAVLAWVRAPENVMKYYLDPARIALVGHSFGAWLALLGVEPEPSGVCVAALAPWNVGGTANRFGAHPDERDETLKLFRETADAAGGPIRANPNELLDEVTEHAASWDYGLRAKALKDRSVLLVAATQDKGEVNRNAELAAAIGQAGGKLVRTVTFEDDHPFSSHRIELADKLVHWLRNDCMNAQAADQTRRPSS